MKNICAFLGSLLQTSENFILLKFGLYIFQMQSYFLCKYVLDAWILHKLNILIAYVLFIPIWKSDPITTVLSLVLFFFYFRSFSFSSSPFVLNTIIPCHSIHPSQRLFQLPLTSSVNPLSWPRLGTLSQVLLRILLMTNFFHFYCTMCYYY